MSIEKIIEMIENKKEIYSDGITTEEYFEEMDFLIELLRKFEE